MARVSKFRYPYRWAELGPLVLKDTPPTHQEIAEFLALQEDRDLAIEDAIVPGSVFTQGVDAVAIAVNVVCPANTNTTVWTIPMTTFVPDHGGVLVTAHVLTLGSGAAGVMNLKLGFKSGASFIQAPASTSESIVGGEWVQTTMTTRGIGIVNTANIVLVAHPTVAATIQCLNQQGEDNATMMTVLSFVTE